MPTGDEVVVYFPMLNVPASAWLMRHLIYFDRLLIPTPLEVAGRADENFDGFTRELMDRGLVGYEFPENHFGAIERTCSAFVDGLWDVDLDARRESMKTSPTFGIHQGKTADGLLAHLGDVGLARRDHDGWWEVERSTAHEYMAAVSLTIATELEATAVTDSEIAVAAVIGDVDLARTALLGDALPSPATLDLNVLEQIRRRREELVAFRRETEIYAHLVARAITPEEADGWRQKYRDRVHHAEADLALYMSTVAKAGRVLRGSFGGLVAGRLGALVGLVQTLAGFKSGPELPDSGFVYSAEARAVYDSVA